MTDLDPQIRQAFDNVRLDPALRQRLADQAQPKTPAWSGWTIAVAAAATVALVAVPLVRGAIQEPVDGLAAGGMNTTWQGDFTLHSDDTFIGDGDTIDLVSHDSSARCEVASSMGRSARLSCDAEPASGARASRHDGSFRTVSVTPELLEGVRPGEWIHAIGPHGSVDALLLDLGASNATLWLGSSSLRRLQSSWLSGGVNLVAGGKRVVTLEANANDPAWKGLEGIHLYATDGTPRDIGEVFVISGTPRTMLMSPDQAQSLGSTDVRNLRFVRHVGNKRQIGFPTDLTGPVMVHIGEQRVHGTVSSTRPRSLEIAAGFLEAVLAEPNRVELRAR